MNSDSIPTPGLIPLLTLTLWTLCSAVGVAEWMYRTSEPRARAPAPVATSIEITTFDRVFSTPDNPAPNVLENVSEARMAKLFEPVPDVPALPDVGASPKLAMPAPLAITAPVGIAPHAVATTSPTRGTVIAVAPVAGPPGPAAPQAQARIHLTLGVGEGNQPPPEYPREAALARQQGDVGIALDVDASGRVADARISQPSRWPILNQAALRTVRDRWRFRTGEPRRYDVTFVFQLPNR